ncbi:hypothetical protein GCM10022255_058720 [Dactylosporangium darangshiense]|uniref:Uncharacterized protein n=1 Tax=Dactylosporangium darangshiense TaxID=579108 RepID=A0ABP8DEX1_9ACTN
MPNELTPATRGSSGRGHGPDDVWTCRLSASRAMAGFGVAKLRLGGSCRLRMLRATLSRPTMPAAASRWPTLVLAEPTSKGPVAVPGTPTAAPSAAASIGSPTGVPVPWSSTYWTDCGATAARS